MIVDELTGILVHILHLTAPLALNDAEEKKYCEALTRIGCGHCLSSNQLTTSSLLLLGINKASWRMLGTEWFLADLILNYTASLWFYRLARSDHRAAMLCITDKPHVVAKFIPG